MSTRLPHDSAPRPGEKARLTKARIVARAFRRRIAALGPGSVFASSLPAGAGVVYIDIGLHKKALQLRYMKDRFGTVANLRTFGFEAHPDYFREAVAAVRPGPNDTLLHAAVVGPEQGASVRLNLNGREGLGDSIVRSRGGEGIDVPAVRLSEVLKSSGIDRSDDVVILRMNIEGAELYVLEDLEQAGLLERIDGFYGYWDDPLKIGGEVATRFAEIMVRTGIDNFPFNDRDFRHPVRLAAVKYDLVTSILAGLRRRSGASGRQ